MSGGTWHDGSLANAMKAAAMEEVDGTAERRRKEQARREKRENAQLPGRAVVHRFMKTHQRRMAGMLHPCIRRYGDKHSEMCDALERLRTRRNRR